MQVRMANADLLALDWPRCGFGCPTKRLGFGVVVVRLQAADEVRKAPCNQVDIFKPLRLLRQLPFSAQVKVMANLGREMSPLEEVLIRPGGAAVMVTHEDVAEIRLGAEEPEHPAERLAPQGNDL